MIFIILDCHYTCSECKDETEFCLVCRGDRNFEKSVCVCPRGKFDQQKEFCDRKMKLNTLFFFSIEKLYNIFSI